MSNNFIGLVIKPNEPVTLAIDEGIHFTMASLIDDAKPGRSTLKVRVRDQEFALCSLTFDEVEQQALDVYFKDVDEPTLILSGVNPINLTGNVMQEDDDFVPEEDDDQEDDYGPIQFRDPSDERFLGGFELRHFGLEPHYSFYPDRIDLRQEEVDEEDTMLHDNIAMGLINAMLNSGNEVKVKKAKAILEKLKSKTNEKSSENQGKISKKQAPNSSSSNSQQQKSKKKDKKKKNKV